MAGKTFEPEFEKEPALASAAPVEERRAVQLSKEEQAYLGAVESESTGESEATEEQPAAADTSATWAAPAAPSETEAQTHPDPAGAEAAESEVLEDEMDSVTEREQESAGSEGSSEPDRAGHGA